MSLCLKAKRPDSGEDTVVNSRVARTVRTCIAWIRETRKSHEGPTAAVVARFLYPTSTDKNCYSEGSRFGSVSWVTRAAFQEPARETLCPLDNDYSLWRIYACTETAPGAG
jgi:hypothetical protein